MKDEEIFNLTSNGKKNFGVKCAKFTGAITVEIIKSALQNHRILTSPRDVFIKGLPIEIDLLIPKKEAALQYGLVYQPQDVLAVLEIKNTGSFGESTINSIKKNFQRISHLNKEIYLAYVTLMERKGYKWAISKANLGFPAYTLFWHSGSGAKFTTVATGDWKRLLDDIRNII